MKASFIKQYSSSPCINKEKELADLTEKKYFDDNRGDNLIIDKRVFLNLPKRVCATRVRVCPPNYR